MSTTFDAGTVHAQLELRRGNFNTELNKVKKDLNDFEKKMYSGRLGLDTTIFNAKLANARTKMTQFGNQSAQARLELNQAVFNASVMTAEARLRLFTTPVHQVRVRLDSSGLAADVATVLAQLNGLGSSSVTPRVEVSLNTVQAWQDYLNFRAQIEGMPPVVIDLRIDDTSARATINRIRAQLQGLGGDSSRAFALLRMGLMRLMSPLMSVSKLLMGLGAAGAIPAILSLVAALGAAAGALIALVPAALAAGAVVGGTLATAFNGLGDAIKASSPEELNEAMSRLAPSAREVVRQIRGMGEAWTALRLDVQQEMFVGLGEIIHKIGHAYLPVLRTGLRESAMAFNDLFTGIGEFMLEAESISDLGVIMNNTNAATRASIPGWTALMDIMKDLAAVGSSFLPGFAEGWSRALTGFSTFIDEMRASGELEAFFRAGLDALSSFRDVLVNLGVIFYEVFSAASASGASLLDTLVLVTNTVVDFLQSAEGQTALITLFTTLNQVASALAPAFGVLLSAAAQIITIVTPALVPIAEALSAIFLAVEPLIKPLAQVVAFLGEYLAAAAIALTPLLYVIADVVGNVLVAAMNALAPVLDSVIAIFVALSPTLEQVARIIGEHLVVVIEAIAPLLPPIVDAFGEILLAMAPLVPVIAELATQMIQALLPAIEPIIDSIMVLVKALAPLVTQLVNALMPVLPDIADLFVVLVEAIAPIIPMLIDALVPSIVDLVAASVRLVEALMPTLEVFIQLAKIVLPPAIAVLGFLLKIVAEVAAFFIDVLVAAINFVAAEFESMNQMVTDVGNFFMWLWNDVLVPAWSGIKQAVSDAIDGYIKPALDTLSQAAQDLGNWFVWLWNDVITPVWNGIVEVLKWAAAIIFTVVMTPIILAVKAVGAIMFWLWENAVRPAWDALSSFIADVWNNVIRPAWDQLMAALDTVGRFFQDTWNNVIRPAWEATGTGINTVWVNVIQPAWEALKAALGVVGQFFVDTWNNVIRPAWDALGTGIRAVWENVVRPAWDALKAALQVVGDFFVSIWNNVIKPAWDAFGNGIRTVWESMVRPAFDAIKSGVDLVRSAFDTAVEGIRVAWNKIVEITRPPIAFVVNVVYNEGIRPAWNFIADLFDLPLLPAKTFATGGLVPGYAPGRDTVPALLSPGEGVLVPEAVRMLGPETVIAINKAAMGSSGRGPRGGGDVGYLGSHGLGQHAQRFAEGGIVSDVTNWLWDAAGSVGDFVGGIIDFFADPVKAVKAAFAGIAQGGLGGAGELSNALTQILPKTVDAAVEAIKKLVESMAGAGAAGGAGHGAALAFAHSQNGKPYVWGASGPGGYDCSGFMSALTNIIRGRPPHSRLGATATMPWNGFVRGTAGAFTIGNSRNTGSGIGHMAGTLLGTNVEARGGRGVVVGPGARGTMDGLFPEKYAFAFDRGGPLRPGWTVAYNGTGRDEYVNTSEQLNTLVRRTASGADLRGREIGRMTAASVGGADVLRKLDEVVDAARENGGINIGSLNTLDTASKQADEIMFRVKHARRPGVHQ